VTEWSWLFMRVRLHIEMHYIIISNAYPNPSHLQ